MAFSHTARLDPFSSSAPTSLGPNAFVSGQAHLGNEGFRDAEACRLGESAFGTEASGNVRPFPDIEVEPKERLSEQEAPCPSA